MEDFLVKNKNEDIKTPGYLVMEEACKLLLSQEITEEEFINTLDRIYNLVEDIELEFEDILFDEYKDEAEIEKAIDLYIEGLENYKDGISRIEQYFNNHDERLLNFGLSKILTGGQLLYKVKDLLSLEELDLLYEGPLLNDKGLEGMCLELKKQLLPDRKENLDREKLKTSRRKADILRLIPLFSVLSKEKLEKMENRVKLNRFEKDEILFNEGDISDELHIIKRGQVTFYRGKGRKIKDLTTLVKGDFFGEIGIIMSSPRSLSARVTSEIAEIYTISKSDFLYMLNKYPELSLKLAKILCERLKERGEQIMYLSLQADY